jgi:hypothetical protein
MPPNRIKNQNLQTVPLGTMDATLALSKMERLEDALGCFALKKESHIARKRTRLKKPHLMIRFRTVKPGTMVAIVAWLKTVKSVCAPESIALRKESHFV